jgi:hypothetical protein
LKQKRGLGFVEVIVAILIAAACAAPVIYMVTSSRTDTSKAINYLRAMELANEAIEWATISRFSSVNDSTFSALAGPITTDEGGGLRTADLALGSPDNTVWSEDGLITNQLSYSQQYNNAFFYREIDIEDISDSHVNDGLLKKVTVTVKWSEGHRPANLNIPDDRSRQVQLSVLILNDQQLSY